MSDQMYPVLKQGQRVAVNTGYHVLTGIVIDSDDIESKVVIAGFGRRTFARFDVFAVPDECARLKEVVAVHVATLTQRVEKIVADGEI